MEEKREKRAALWSAALLLILAAALAAGLWLSGRTAGESSAPAAAPAPNPTAAPGVFISGQYYPRKTQELRLKGDAVTAGELRQALTVLENLRLAEIPQGKFDFADQLELKREHPEIRFVWPVTVCGHVFLSTDEDLRFAGTEDFTASSLEEIRERSELFYALRSVDLTGCALDSDALHQLDLALGDVDVVWTFPLYGKEVCSTDREIDLSGIAVKDKGAQAEEALPYFTHLEKVVMCECGVSDKDMDALNNRHEDVRFVWMVDIQWAAIRTDSDFFIPYRSSGVKQTRRRAGLSGLQYCPDLIALDIGHAHTQDISYIRVMPHLKYLILAENYVVDISPLEDLKELKWLEMFQCVTRDLSPLLGCTALEDLNICYLVAPRDNVFETLKQMTWLKRLWVSGSPLTKKQVAELREALPDCEIWNKMGDESTGSTWRFSESYYEMRDAFHMYYMNITGNRTRRLSPEELQKVHDKFWK